MKKIINLIKSDNIYLLVIIHGSYTLFVATCAPIGGFIVGGYYFVADYFSLYFNKDKESEDDVNV